ncbi:hypothetical protein AMTRI_Chr09g22950 [Amborella trichopoda]
MAYKVSMVLSVLLLSLVLSADALGGDAKSGNKGNALACQFAGTCKTNQDCDVNCKGQKVPYFYAICVPDPFKSAYNCCCLHM